MKVEVLKVSGMTCGGCVSNVEGALKALPGVQSVATSLSRNEAEVRFDESKVSIDAMRNALRGAGYDVATAGAKTERRGGCGCS